MRRFLLKKKSQIKLSQNAHQNPTQKISFVGSFLPYTFINLTSVCETYYVPSKELGAPETMGNETEVVPTLTKLTLWWGRQILTLT